MSFSFLQGGYSGLLSIGSNSSSYAKTLATSFDLTVNQNYIKSQGIFGSLFDKDTKKFSRLGGLAYRDWAGYELSVGLEATISIFSKLMNVLNNSRQKFCLRFQDKAYGCDIVFNDAYVNSLSFQVSNNSLTSLSAGFFIVKRDLELNFIIASNSSIMDYGINSNSNWGYVEEQWNGDEIRPELELMPYYGWGFSYGQEYGAFSNNY